MQTNTTGQYGLKCNFNLTLSNDYATDTLPVGWSGGHIETIFNLTQRESAM